MTLSELSNCRICNSKFYYYHHLLRHKAATTYNILYTQTKYIISYHKARQDINTLSKICIKNGSNEFEDNVVNDYIDSTCRQ